MDATDPPNPAGPLSVACLHLATDAEHRRDPRYRACNAQAGEPCQWAARYDGALDPAFHSERIEAASAANGPRFPDAQGAAAFRAAVLGSGLV